MAQLKIGVESPEVRRLIGEFDQLSKAEQKMVMQGTAVGQSLDLAGKKGRDSFGKFGSTMRNVVGGLIGAGSAAGLMATAVAKARQHFQELEQMQQRAAQSQQTWSEATGAFISNNPQLGNSGVQQFMAFATDQGKTLGEGGPQRVLQALTALRSGTPGASDAEQMAAMQRAVMQAQLDPNTDLGSFATAIVKLQQSAGMDATQASSLLTMFGARAGGDIGGLAGRIGQLMGVQGVSGTSTQDILSMFGFLTAELGDPTGEQSSTAVRNMLTKISTRDIKIGGKDVQFETEGGVNRVMELLDRIQSGEFGDQQRAIAEAAKQLMEGAQGVAALGALAAGRSRFEETRAMVAGVESGTDFTAQQLERKRALLPAEDSIRRSAESGGGLTAAENVSADAERERVRKRLADLQQQLGVTGVTDFMPFRDIMSQISGQSPAEFEQEQRLRILAKSLGVMPGEGRTAYVGGSLGGVTDREDAALAFFRERGISEDEAKIYALAFAGGSINAFGGIDRAESSALVQAGIDARTIAELNKLFNDGQKEAFAEGLRSVIEELSESMAAALARQIQRNNGARGQAQNLDLIAQ